MLRRKHHRLKHLHHLLTHNVLVQVRFTQIHKRVVLLLLHLQQLVASSQWRTQLIFDFRMGSLQSPQNGNYLLHIVPDIIFIPPQLIIILLHNLLNTNIVLLLILLLHLHVLPLRFLNIPLDLHQLSTTIKTHLHLPAMKVRVLKIHIIPLLDQFHHLAKFVHIELPDKRRQVFMPEEMRQHLILQFFWLLY